MKSERLNWKAIKFLLVIILLVLITKHGRNILNYIHKRSILGHRDEPEDQMPPEDIIDYNDEEPIPSSQRRDLNSSD